MTDINQTNEPNPDQAPTEGYTPPVGKHKFLLTLVIGMGLLFFVGMVALIYAVIQKSGDETTPIVAENPSSYPSRSTAFDGTSFGTIDIQKPENSTLVDYTSDGTYLTLRFKTTSGEEELIIIHLTTGKEQGRLKLTEQ